MPKQKILIIDHDAQAIEETRNALVSAGYSVEVARDGVAGLEAFHRAKPDLVVVDPLVTKKQGFEVCKEIKQSNGGSTPVLIATDSYRDSDNRESAIRFHGCDEFLERPLTREHLVSMCRRFLVPAQEVPSPTPAPRCPAKPGAAIALDDLDEDEIISRLDSLIDENFLTGEQPAAANTAGATPEEALPAAIEMRAEPPAAAPPVEPAATPPPAEVEPVPLATSKAPKPAATPAATPGPPARQAPVPTAAPVARAVPLPATSPVVPAAATAAKRRRRPSALLLAVAALAGLAAVAAIALAPRWLRQADSPPAPGEMQPVAESPRESALPAAPTATDSAAAVTTEGAEARPETGLISEVPAPVETPVAVAESIPSRPAPERFAATPTDSRPSPRPAVVPGVAAAPEAEAESRFLNLEPLEDRALIPLESGVADLEQLIPSPEAPRIVPDTLFALAEVDVGPAAVRRKLPSYPPAARRMGLQGVVELDALVDFRGKVVDARVTRSNAGKVLDRAAVEAVKGWTYRPAVKGGVAVRVWMPVRVEFKN